MEDAKTLIADDVEITGSMKCSGGVKMAGKLNGDLSCAGEVLVEKGAAIKGNVAAASIVVWGMVKGNILAKERIELKGTARVAGDIKAKRLVVEEGVTLIGKSEISSSDSVSDDGSIEVEPPVSKFDDVARIEDDPVKAVGGMRPVMDNRTRTGQLFARK
jgi:cytoskeletal protein CcmA (bactofilin family)